MKFSYACAALIAISSGQCHAHWEAVHKEISSQAANSSTGLGDFLTDYFGAVPSASVKLPLLLDEGIQGLHNPVTWIKVGSNDEDGGINGNPPKDDIVAGRRSRNHFYRPDTGSGLTDGWDFSAINSFDWASTRNIGGPIALQKYSWQNARDSEFDALTSPTKVARDENLAKVMYSLGHVLHLNQDLTQPDHSRNDQHIDSSEKAVENFGLEYLKKAKTSPTLKEEMFPKSTRTWASWHNAGFVRLKEFWDRAKYSGTVGISTALKADVSGGTDQLGLAEFVNGNFVTKDASYREYEKIGDSKHYFAYPSLESSTTFKNVRTAFGAALKNVDFSDGFTGAKAFVDKTSDDGIEIRPHSQITHNGVMFRSGKAERFKVATTVDEPTVLNAYYSKLIPKAIEYSAGILDYFFRGKLEVVSVVWGGSQYTITVRNQSGQELVDGGKFFVLKDEANGDRSFVTSENGVSLTQNVSDGSTWQFNFPGPQVAEPTKFIVIYKGTIGLTSGQPSDSVDANIAIAAKGFVVACQGNPTDFADANWAYNLNSHGSIGATISYPNATFYFLHNIATRTMLFYPSQMLCNPPGTLQLKAHLEGTITSPTGCSGTLRVTLNGTAYTTPTQSSDDQASKPFSTTSGPTSIPFSLDVSVAVTGPAAENSFTLSLQLDEDSGQVGATGTITFSQ